MDYNLLRKVINYINDEKCRKPRFVNLTEKVYFKKSIEHCTCSEFINSWMGTCKDPIDILDEMIMENHRRYILIHNENKSNEDISHFPGLYKLLEINRISDKTLEDLKQFIKKEIQ